jgi:hypothetical protein
MDTVTSTHELHVTREYNKIVFRIYFSSDYIQRLNCLGSFLSFSEKGSLQLKEDVEKKQKWELVD